MTEQQKIWFEKLFGKRNNTANTLMEDFAVGNMWDSVVEKYSDQAHFIYELLQNADDAKATMAEFNLKVNGLYFKHNGTKHFWVSNPETEKKDKQINCLGDINSITAVAQSNKTDHSTIGKFGVGFKAVFQYSKTPHIYDRDFQFKIERFIVPVKLKMDIDKRKSDETVFYFPFDKKEMPKVKAYADILGKLKSLSYPILFLSNLLEVRWDANGETGEYSQKIIREVEENGNISYRKLELSQQVGMNKKNEKMLLFSRQIEGRLHSYSVGFFLEKGKLKPKNLPAFCFFPTKETTNLNFIVHAPFLLTDSREGIKRNEGWNKKAVKKLAKLASDSFLILRDMQLIDDDIINIIPYQENDFLEDDSEEEKLFYPFFKKIKKKFQTEELLPAKDGEYTNKKNAYWADTPDLTFLFSNEKLSQLTGNPHAKWVFTTLGRRKDSEITDYIDGGSENSWNRKEPNLIKANLDLENKIANMIDTGFIEKQTFEWLHQFYEYLSERKSYIEKFKTKPIFKDTGRNPAAAFRYESNTKNYHPILFLPSDGGNSAFITIHKNLLSNKYSKEFITAFGIKEPDIKDEIFHILPLYDIGGEIDTDTHFKKFFRYYKENHGNKTIIDNFITLLKDKEFVSYKSKKDQKTYRGRPCEIYYPNKDLDKYFETKPDTLFVDLDDYHKQIDNADRELLYEFLLKLGVSTIPKVLTIEITDWREKNKLPLSHSTRNYVFDKIIDGSSEIVESKDISRLQLLWKQMIKIVNSYQNFNEVIKGKHDYFYYSARTEYFKSSAEKFLHESKWLATKNGNFVAPHKITINDLAEGYDVKSTEAQLLIELLQFKPSVILTKEQRISQMFGSEEEARRAKELLENEKAKTELKTKQNSKESEYDSEELENAIEKLDSLSKSIVKTKPHQEKIKKNILSSDFDEDDELAKGVTEIKNKLEIKKSRRALSKAINESTKYSYQWFEAYLKLLLTYSEKQTTIKQKSVSFQEIKRYNIDDKVSDKYFLLCGASAYIPQSIEDSEDLKVTLIRKNHRDENVKVEGVSKKGQDLLIYCRESIPQSLVSRLSSVIRVEIKFTPVVELLDKLFKAFVNKNNIIEWEDIKETLPALKYIYGPPGTGKTTSLCNKIIDILKENRNAKFLILTPTNKAADVLCKKLYNINSDILIARLGTASADPELKEMDEEIYRDSLSKNALKYINVVVSTIHRLPYYVVNSEKENEKLSYKLFKHRNFDYVIFDESSMTGLHYIVFAILSLFKTNPNAQFIVAGDPKQIPPVIEVNDNELENFDFQDENIYKMMGLGSFNPKEQNVREIDEIENLDKQYRSTKQIGQLFSELSYSKLLQHDREVNRKESKTLPGEFKTLISTAVTFIDIPLNQEDSIYKINKLLYSSYQTYCAILVSEIVKYFDAINKNQQWTIGLIAPYKAQAILMNKLITSFGISEEVKVYSDTVHGFQGDECDIVFFISNPNNYYYTNHPKCLLSKEYIYNVAISRAKDYLIILHPYSTIRDNEFIEKISQSYRNNFGNHLVRPSSEVEKILFGKEKFIENNTYITGHDNVNVFGLTDMKYFIKSSESAIDIQLRNMEVDLP